MDPPRVRAQLDRILASAAFADAERSSRFLRFVVEAALETGLADCYSIIGSAIVGTVPSQEVAPKAKAAALKALQLDEGYARSLAVGRESQVAIEPSQRMGGICKASTELGFASSRSLGPGYDSRG
jgi:hypothetical protein